MDRNIFHPRKEPRQLFGITKKGAVRLLCSKSLRTRPSRTRFIHIRVYGVVVFTFDDDGFCPRDPLHTNTRRRSEAKRSSRVVQQRKPNWQITPLSRSFSPDALNTHLLRTQVRSACVEDHDDLMPVFAAQSDLLSATYGEFFLADMIELQDDENKVLLVGTKKFNTRARV